MQTATSADGTEIAYLADGHGPPLVLVHGGSATHESFDSLLPHLAEEFTVVRPDRRGRGGSGDGEDYSIQREIEDLAAVLDEIDGDATVFGHSFGGFVSLAAAIDGVSIERLLLYEPAVLVGEYREHGDLADRMQAALSEGDRRRSMKLFFKEAGGVPEPEHLPTWPEQINFHLTETVVRENYAIEEFVLPDSPTVDVPTLLLTGERGPEQLKASVRALDDRVPNSEVVELDGLGHVAIETAPDVVADVVREFTLNRS